MAAPRWQHQRPKTTDECDGPEPMHTVDDNNPNRLELRSPTWCTKCGAIVVLVDEDEGPESLKALLRF